jgi:orotidine-5'-phosphate decarboxylase
MVRKKGGGVFLDLKFHDIPNTVASAVRQAVRLGVMMMTLHVCGGKEMMRRAADAAGEEAAALKVRKPFLVGVTVLTSDTGSGNTLDTVLERAQLAKAAGLDGVVCSVHETAQVRKVCGPDFVIVTPGIRPKGADAQDQKRVATAADAVSAGSTYLVVGRPILEAEDPILAVETLF